eukprot:7750510-Lingulodinium_polyedra.AAC.1
MVGGHRAMAESATCASRASSCPTELETWGRQTPWSLACGVRAADGRRQMATRRYAVRSSQPRN